MSLILGFPACSAGCNARSGSNTRFVGQTRATGASVWEAFGLSVCFVFAGSG